MKRHRIVLVAALTLPLGGPGRLAETRLCRIADLLEAFNEGRIYSYNDVAAMSK